MLSAVKITDHFVTLKLNEIRDAVCRQQESAITYLIRSTKGGMGLNPLSCLLDKSAL